jgi:hypothetical protein
MGKCLATEGGREQHVRAGAREQVGVGTVDALSVELRRHVGLR